MSEETKEVMLPNQYQDLAMRTKCSQEAASKRIYQYDQAENFIATQLLHCVIGLAGEVGELATAMQRWLWYGKPLDRVNFIEEIGDANWYAAEGCDALSIRVMEVLVRNINKLKTRFPDAYSNFLAAEENRDREAERKILEGVRDASIENDKLWDNITKPSKGVKAEEYAPTKEEVEFKTTTGQEPYIIDLINQALARGWTIMVHQALKEVATPRPSLILNGDSSLQWAARWYQVDFGGTVIAIPHFLEQRMRELGHWPVKTAQDFAHARPLSASYDSRCAKCGNPIHKNNTTGYCADCIPASQIKKSL